MPLDQGVMMVYDNRVGVRGEYSGVEWRALAGFRRMFVSKSNR